MELETGAVKVMAGQALASTPTRGDCGAEPQRSRNRSDRYPPGSTMKVVTAAAAIDSGKYTPGLGSTATPARTSPATPLHNFGDEDFGSIP